MNHLYVKDKKTGKFEHDGEQSLYFLESKVQDSFKRFSGIREIFFQDRGVTYENHSEKIQEEFSLASRDLLGSEVALLGYLFEKVLPIEVQISEFKDGSSVRADARYARLCHVLLTSSCYASKNKYFVPDVLGRTFSREKSFYKRVFFDESFFENCWRPWFSGLADVLKANLQEVVRNIRPYPDDPNIQKFCLYKALFHTDVWTPQLSRKLSESQRDAAVAFFKDLESKGLVRLSFSIEDNLGKLFSPSLISKGVGLLELSQNSLVDLGLSPKVSNKLAAQGIFTPRDLESKSCSELRSIPQIGPYAIGEIESLFSRFGFVFNWWGNFLEGGNSPPKNQSDIC